MGIFFGLNPREESLSALGLQVRSNDQQPELDSCDKSSGTATAQQQQPSSSSPAE